MQTKQTTGLRTAANDYVTIVAQASAKVKGFKQLYTVLQVFFQKSSINYGYAI